MSLIIKMAGEDAGRSSLLRLVETPITRWQSKDLFLMLLKGEFIYLTCKSKKIDNRNITPRRVYATKVVFTENYYTA